MRGFDQAREALGVIVDEMTDCDLNEATTRRNVIDRVLRDALAWPDDQVTCELYESGDYLDYALGAPIRRAILEAKRSGLTFEVPAGTGTGEIALRTVRDHSRANREAIDQVLKYCQESGVGLAFLSNGAQWLAFLGSRADGLSPIDGRAVFHASLADILEDFNRFWDLYSLPGVERGDLVRRLTRKSRQAPPPQPLSSRLTAYPGYRIGSEMETDLSILGDLFIQDVVREETITDEFLAECYCSSGALSQYAVVSKEILKTRYIALADTVNTEPARGRKGTNSTLSGDVVAGAITRRPILLLGDVGVGKSIFLKHLFRIEAREIMANTCVFYVDFLKHSGIVADVPEFLVRVMKETLSKSYSIDIDDRAFVRSVYNGEINSFKRGIYGELEESDPSSYRAKEIQMLADLVHDSYEHLRRSLAHLQSAKHLNFVVALDNVDQHQAIFQEQIFMAGQSLAETWPVAVFMSLRPDTFYESRRSGVLAAYQPRVFTVSPPRSDLVVLKRLEFARAQLDRFGRLPGFPNNLTLDSSSLEIYIDVLLDAFRTNAQLIEMVDNLSSGNTRRALDFISTFVGSGYVQTSRILDAHKRGRSYVIPLHEFLRAILYGDHRYYDPESSPVPNAFAVSSSDPQEHFLLPMLLAGAQRLGEAEAGGFADQSVLFKYLQEYGYSPDQIEYHLARILESDLAEVADHGESGALIRVTPAGGYLHRKLISTFAYFDAVIVDTPIMDPQVRSGIRDVADIESRVERAELFAGYLDVCWAFDDDATFFSWPDVRQDLDRAIQQVREGAARAASRRNR